MTVRKKPHCGSSGVPFIKSTTGDASMAFWICARAPEDSSRLRTDDVIVGDLRVKGASWSNAYAHIGLFGRRRMASNDRIFGITFVLTKSDTSTRLGIRLGIRILLRDSALDNMWGIERK